MEERQQAAAEEAAGPAALAAAGRFVPGGVTAAPGQSGGPLMGELMDGVLDIEVELNGDSDEIEDDSQDDDVSGTGSEEDGGSDDEHMQQAAGEGEVSWWRSALSANIRLQLPWMVTTDT